ncbi:hypothetical protein L1987_21406 [Smallanthus sonchifolius]|uniref:Uncharacterized protein n=1 Tax=Smallanthus sonchifolius TaxID=185202 RepID=A0ACB9IVH8_9ASTR|nr:hypothetical protein L1987_21406 [Smallanthus sonchifolius]
MLNALTKKEVASWNTLIMGYGMCGASDSALGLFESMKDERKVHQIEPKQLPYACMVDLFDRGQMVLAAADLIHTILRNVDLMILVALLKRKRRLRANDLGTEFHGFQHGSCFCSSNPFNIDSTRDVVTTLMAIKCIQDLADGSRFGPR